MHVDLRQGPGLTYAAAARRIGVSRSWVSRLVKARRLSTVTEFGRSYISGPSLAAFVANRTRRDIDRLTPSLFNRK